MLYHHPAISTPQSIDWEPKTKKDDKIKTGTHGYGRAGIVAPEPQTTRPHTPTLHPSRAGPTSPSETPITGYPTCNRRHGPRGRRLSNPMVARRGPQRSQMQQPLGGVGSQFKFSCGMRPVEILPQSYSSSENEYEDKPEDEDDREGEEYGSLANPPELLPSDAPIPDMRQPMPHIATRTLRIIAEANFSIEEMQDDDDDDMGSDCEHLAVLRPSGFEYPESDRSRSRSRPPPELDTHLMTGLKDLHCFESDDSDIDYDDEHGQDKVMRAVHQHRRKKRERRMTSGSISKRTVSERGSDSDREDLKPWDTGEAGPNLRRLRRKTDRKSLLSIPPEVIYELTEPKEDEIILGESELLARELPYFEYMAVDSE
ncbi:uncharacterized protein BCR38DRAFT_413032 [Pseudomassariella vexata]|uniref:Uncharacterized protein n=1 Tax=Pseudomassariella vexata TaxID=1141098 RepID=A0A1Y2DHJ1_9PEZI|nr:uncharacterized protein BCR38DRAFT_413032 [Pseudomassariella vexata]ORY58709.1 hypothetical protein BCR38DRAFT_413032 [Pseudomassariella vexata]